MANTQRLVLLIAILASFVAFLDGSVVNVALPKITSQLGGGLAVQQWIVDGYTLTLGAFILLAGSLSDTFGQKRILTYGLIGFGITSLLCAYSPNSNILIFSRLLQGGAAALLVPSSLALIISTFKGEEQAKAIGRWTAWTGVAFVIGPLFGGFLIDALSWRWIFAINLIPILLTLQLLHGLPYPEEKRGRARLDLLGGILCVTGLGLPVYALIEQPKYGASSPVFLLPLVLGLAILFFFLRTEKRKSNAILPLSIFRVRNFKIGNLATASIYAGLAIATFLLAIYLQQIAGYSALDAGLALLPVTIVMFGLSPIFGSLSGKYGPRFFMTAGPLTAAAGFLLMLSFSSHAAYFSHLLPGILLFALGLSCTVSPLTSAVLSDVEPGHAGIASAVNNAISRIAGLVAIACIGLITGKSLTTNGFHRTLIATALLMAVGGIISALGIRNRKDKSRHDSSLKVKAPA
ncbi:MAG TPA: MFS transporter [Candidatus Saccharimonadales bacterium]|nr:MFS transporter [Candidatus Saccharimonadales bacterium]